MRIIRVIKGKVLKQTQSSTVGYVVLSIDMRHCMLPASIFLSVYLSTEAFNA